MFSSLTSKAWQQIIEHRVSPEVLESLNAFLEAESLKGKEIFPPQDKWFHALNIVPPEDVRVVILGQDPYHGAGQAQGLSFSVPSGMKLPPSLRNIFKEQSSDLNIQNEDGDLTGWAQQGVLLLNAVLTVESARANSHAKKGWEAVTDAVIESLSEQKGIVFMLWGAYAEKKKALIDDTHHKILTSAHPSPLSAHRGWFGSAHFSQANLFLEAQGRTAIDWRTQPKAQGDLF